MNNIVRRKLSSLVWLLVLPILVTQVAMASRADAVQAVAQGRVEQFASLGGSLRGQWHCAGHFSNGKEISSEESFASLLGGAWLQQVHDDQPPFGYHAYSNWGLDRQTGQLMVTVHDIAGGLRLFMSSDWTPTSVTLNATPIGTRDVTRERFEYRLQSADLFTIEYYIQTAGASWKLGDHLDCARKV